MLEKVSEIQDFLLYIKLAFLLIINNNSKAQVTIDFSYLLIPLKKNSK